MLAGLEKLGNGRKVLARLEHLDVAKDEVAVHEAVERGFLPGILAVAKPLLLAADVPRHFLVVEGLAVRAVDERNLHRGRKVIGFNRLVCFLQVFHGYFCF